MINKFARKILEDYQDTKDLKTKFFISTFVVLNSRETMGIGYYYL